MQAQTMQGGAGIEGRASIYGDLWKKGLEHLAVGGDVQDPLAQVGAVYTAVSILSQSLASVPWTLFKGEDRVEEHPLYDLMAGAGSDSLAGTQLLEGSVAWRETKGRAFWHLNGIAGVGARRRPTVLELLDPARMTAVAPNGDLTGWKYQAKAGADITLPADEVVRFSYFDHRDPLGGLAPLEAARLGYRLNWRSSKFQDQFYEQGGFPPFYVKLPPGASLTPEEQERVRTDFREKYLGLKNAWVPPIMARGAELESIGVNQRDAEWLATQKATIWDILSIFQVPAEYAGYTEGANLGSGGVSVQAARRFWLGRIRGIGEHFATVIQKRIVDVFWPGLLFRFDWQSKLGEVMPEETRASIESAGKLWSMGTPLDEAFRVTGLAVDTLGKPWMKEGFIPFSMVRVSDLDVPPEDEDEDGDLPDDDEDEAESRGRVVRAAARNSSWPAPGSKLRDALWRSYTTRTDKIERLMLGDYRKFLTWIRDATLANLRSSGSTAGRFANIDAIARDDSKPAVPPDSEVAAKAKAATDASHKRAAKVGGESVIAELGLDVAFDLTDPRVLKLLAERSKAIAGAGTQAADRIRATLAEGVGENETIDELAERVRAKHREEYAGQAKTVARTETMSAFSGARHEAMEQNGITSREWLTARDDDVRTSHRIDGEVRAMGEAFSNGMMYPCDPSAPPADSVNDRCIELPVVEAA